MKKQIKQIFNPLSGSFDSIQTSDATKDAGQLMLLTADESISDWYVPTGGFSISKVDPLQGDASYVLELGAAKSAIYNKAIPVAPVFRGRSLAFTLDYEMLEGGSRVLLLDQTNSFIEGSSFDLPASNGREKFGAVVFIPNSVTAIKFEIVSTVNLPAASIKFDNVQLSADVLGVIDYSTIPVGTIIESMLTEAQIQAQSGAGIILADGRNVIGSRYHAITGNTTVPDLRGVFTRGKNNGRSDGNQNPDGEKSLGEYTGDAIRNIVGNAGIAANISTTATGVLRTTAAGQRHDGTATSGLQLSIDASRTVPTALDNRPKNVTVNFFIKINDTNLSIVAPTDIVTEKTIAFKFKSTALVDSDPIGTYNTYQYNSSNTISISSTRPAQLDSDMSINGPLIYKRNHNVASVPSQPVVFSIKIAEPGQLSACDLVGYRTAGNLNPVSLPGGLTSTTSYNGLYSETFDPSTGILYLNAGVAPSGTTSNNFLDLNGSNSSPNAYITFTASKLAQGVAIPTPARYVVKTYESGTSWYEVYSDGWVRQGFSAITSTVGDRTVTFFVPMRDSSYSAFRTLITASGGSAPTANALSVHTLTPTTMNFVVATGLTQHSLFIEGYGNSVAVKSHGATPNY